MILGALINVPAGIGYPLLFGLVAAESAGGLVPGETSLIVAAALAAQGQLSLPIVIAVAAGAAILGDNLGKTRPGSGGILLAHEFHRPERTRHVQRSSRLPGLRRTQRQRRSHDHLITCSLCLRVLRGSEWKDADQVIREIRSYELDALPRLDSAVCDVCADRSSAAGPRKARRSQRDSRTVRHGRRAPRQRFQGHSSECRSWRLVPQVGQR